MAKKNLDILLGNILGSAAIKPQDKYEEPVVPLPAEEGSFICSNALVDKVQAIAHKEGFTIRSFMEYVMKQGIEAYESKHGKVKKIKSKEVHEVM